MGLDMYAYVAKKKDEMKEYYESYDYETDSGPVTKPREIAYWRKHPNLHGWMHRLWNEKGHSGDFNGDELELTAEDLDRLEFVVEQGKLPATSGFFFGNDADSHYKEQDLKFIQDARTELIAGEKVFYNSSW
jgi:hypothetical protein